MTNSDDQNSAGGSRILQHTQSDREWTPPAHGASVMEEVTQYFEEHGVPGGTVFHEVVSDLVHLDVHISEPTDSRPYFTLFTTGMSDLPMSVPEEAEVPSRAELMLCLPADWDLRQESLARPENYWPLRLLKSLARLPHERQTWLGTGHTIPNGDPAQPYAEGTALCGALIVPPLTLPDATRPLQSTLGPLQIYAVVPIHESEMNTKLAKGSGVLYDAFDRKGVSEILDPRRKSAIRRRRFWFF